MSDLVFNALARKYAEEMTKELVEKYNSSKELTQEGKRELIVDFIFFAVLHGKNMQNYREKAEVVSSISDFIKDQKDCPPEFNEFFLKNMDKFLA